MHSVSLQWLIRASGIPVLLCLLYVHIYIIQKDCGQWSAMSSHMLANPASKIDQLAAKQSQLGRHVGVLPWHHLAEDGEDQGTAWSSSEFSMSTVHFVWCGSKVFRYKHYLSMLSVYKILQPARIVFHYSHLPSSDQFGYYLYFAEILRDIPNLSLQSMGSHHHCVNDPISKLTFILGVLNEDGGVYVDEEIILTRTVLELKMEFSHSFRLSNKSSNLDRPKGVIILNQFGLNNVTVHHGNIVEILKSAKKMFKCALIQHNTYKLKQQSCVEGQRDLFPVEIMTENSSFAELCRWLTYGSKQPAVPKPFQVSVLPNIVHFVWFGNRTLEFFGYLSLLSALFVLKADTVYIHGDMEPQGKYWQEAKKYPRVYFIFREFPNRIWGNEVNNPSHASDILRADILVRFGGIYMDWDVIWVKPIPSVLQRYELTANVDVRAQGDFPDVFNFGVLLAKPKAQFLQFYLESMRKFIDSDWSFNPIHIPYKIYEKHPSLLHVERHLQVICCESVCHPSWVRDSKELSGFKHMSAAPVDWRNDTLAFHWTFPDPEEFTDKLSLLSSNTMAATIGKFVLIQSEKGL